MKKLCPFVVALGLLAACVGDDAAPTAASDAGAGSDASTPETSLADGGADATPACSPGLTLCGATCVDTATSSASCGACGRDCGGASCTAGACEATKIKDGLESPYGVAVAANVAFWVRPGAVESCAAGGCTGAPNLVTNEVTAPVGTVGGLTGSTIVTDGNYVRWIAAGTGGPIEDSVYGCNAGGCGGAAPKVATATDHAKQLSLVASTLFVSVASGATKSCPFDNCTTFTGIPSSTVDPGFGVAADATSLYYTAGSDPTLGGVIKCPLTGCTPGAKNKLFDGGRMLSLTGTTLVAARNDDAVVACSTAGCSGSPTLLAALQPAITSLVTDATHVYFALAGSSTEATGEIRACALPACAGGPKPVVTAQARPSSLAVKDGFLYWANRGLVTPASGSVWRIRL